MTQKRFANTVKAFDEGWWPILLLASLPGCWKRRRLVLVTWQTWKILVLIIFPTRWTRVEQECVTSQEVLSKLSFCFRWNSSSVKACRILMAINSSRICGQMHVPIATQRAKEGLARISKCMTLRELLGHQHQLVIPPPPPSSRLNASNLSQLAW